MSKSKSNAASAVVPIAPASTPRMARSRTDSDIAPPPAESVPPEALEVDDDAAPGSTPDPATLLEPETAALDEEFDVADVAAEVETIDTLRPPAEKRQDDTSGDSMLSRYFREMATHQVMGPQEELATAIEVEQAEVDHWVAIFSAIPVAGSALDALERELPTGPDALELPQIPAMRKLLQKAAAKQDRLSRHQERKWKALTASLARAIRLADTDRIWVARAEDAARGRSPAGTEDADGIDALDMNERDGAVSADHVARPGHRKLSLRPGPQARAAARGDARRLEGGEEQVRQGEPPPRRVDRAPLQPRPATAHRPHSGGQHRPDEGGRALRPRPRLPLLDLRVLVDPPRDQPRARGQGTRGAHPGPHARHAQPRGASDPGRRRQDRPRPDAGRAASRRRAFPRTSSTRSRDLVGGALLARPRRRRRGRPQVHRLPAGRTTCCRPTRRSSCRGGAPRSGGCSATLTPIESRIIRWRFGLDDEEELTLKEIGDKYNLSRERIRQLQEQALGKIRKHMRD